MIEKDIGTINSRDGEINSMITITTLPWSAFKKSLVCIEESRAHGREQELIYQHLQSYDPRCFDWKTMVQHTIIMMSQGTESSVEKTKTSRTKIIKPTQRKMI